MKLNAEVLFADLEELDKYGAYSVKVKVTGEEKKKLEDEAKRLFAGSSYFKHPKLAEQWYDQQIKARPNKLPYSDGNLDQVVDNETGDLRVRPGLDDAYILKAKSKFKKDIARRGDKVEIDIKLNIYEIKEKSAYGMSAYLEGIKVLEAASSDSDAVGHAEF